jgi:cation diffusion facilitator CzcD-associated flavoprotein CzcO
MKDNLIEYIRDVLYLYDITWDELQEEIDKARKTPEFPLKVLNDMVKVDKRFRANYVIKVTVVLNENQRTDDGKWRVTVKGQEKTVDGRTVDWLCQDIITAVYSFNKDEIRSFTITGGYKQVN